MQRQVQKSILRYGHLRTHLLIYSEEKSQPCGQREVSYREAESLNKHILHHSGENPHSCTECKKAFWQTGSISTHLLIHTGEKLHPCGQCDKSFTQAETLNKHLFFLWFVEVMVEVVLDEVTDEEVEDDIWWLVCPWSRCWTVKEVKGSDGLWRLAFGNVFICDFFKHYDFSPACFKCLA